VHVLLPRIARDNALHDQDSLRLAGDCGTHPSARPACCREAPLAFAGPFGLTSAAAPCLGVRKNRHPAMGNGPCGITVGADSQARSRRE